MSGPERESVRRLFTDAYDDMIAVVTGQEREPTLAELRQAVTTAAERIEALESLIDHAPVDKLDELYAELDHVALPAFHAAHAVLRAAYLTEREYLTHPEPDDFGRPCPHAVVEFGECTECGETV